MDFLDLLFDSEIIRLTGVHRATISRWRRGLSRVPRAVERLLRLFAEGDAEALLGRSWRGWRFGRDGLLYHPQWRTGFTGGELAAMWYRTQIVATLEGQIRLLRQDVERLTAERDEMERLAWQANPARAIMARLNNQGNQK